MSKTIFVTGGAGFIGSALVRYLINETDNTVVNFDKLTYAGNLESLKSIESNDRYDFVQGDICDKEKLDAVLEQFQPDYIMHLAAESHVDRSIDGPGEFIETNVVGTYILLEAARRYYASLVDNKKANFRFHHISTDEVYGDIKKQKRSDEKSSYNPSSPYSASKASADHLVKSFVRTYKLPAIISNCCNNYGPYQFPEKFIPTAITNLIKKKSIPIYGDGKNIREWLHVSDYCFALETIKQGVFAMLP